MGMASACAPGTSTGKHGKIRLKIIGGTESTCISRVGHGDKARGAPYGPQGVSGQAAASITSLPVQENLAKLLITRYAESSSKSGLDTLSGRVSEENVLGLE